MSRPHWSEWDQVTKEYCISTVAYGIHAHTITARGVYKTPRSADPVAPEPARWDKTYAFRSRSAGNTRTEKEKKKVPQKKEAKKKSFRSPRKRGQKEAMHTLTTPGRRVGCGTRANDVRLLGEGVLPLAEQHAPRSQRGIQ